LAEDQIKENQPVENQPETEEEIIATNNVDESIVEESNVDEITPEESDADEFVDADPEAEDYIEAEIDLSVDDEQSAETEKQENLPIDELLLPRDTMLSAGIHIGTRMKTLDMASFIYRVRPDGLFVLDVKKADDRIRTAAKFLARYEKAKVAVAATRLYAHEPVKKFCEVTGSTPIIGRFIPGQLSNPQYSHRVDPEVIVVSDPRADAQAVKEASTVGIPIVALCSTDNEFTGVDLVIPTNNKGRRALAVIFWLLARQILRERGEIGMDKDPQVTIEDFEAKVTRAEEDET
jgi:small subunit ribosomal protein S2